MAATAPKLSPKDLEVELERFHAKEHRTLHTAFYGTGESGYAFWQQPGFLVDFVRYAVKSA